MKNLNILLLILFSISSVGCSVLPINPEIKENHFRLENFKRDKERVKEHVYLMCYKKRPTSWQQPKQYAGGNHNLWVKATLSQHTALKYHLSHVKKEAFANFNVNLAADKSYMLNRKIADKKIHLWLQEVETGKIVSDVKVADLNRRLPFVKANKLEKNRCKTSTI